MARKRLVSPEFFTHEALYQTEARLGLPLRVAFAGLWTQADRRGIFRWRPNQLKLAVLPYDQVDFAAVLDALVTAGFIERYDVDGESYGIIGSFGRWQTFHHAERPSDAPFPPQGSVSPRLTPPKPRVNPTVAVAVAVAGTDTNAVAVGPSAAPGLERPLASGPAETTNDGPATPSRVGKIIENFSTTWRTALSRP